MRKTKLWKITIAWPYRVMTALVAAESILEALRVVPFLDNNKPPQVGMEGSVVAAVEAGEVVVVDYESGKKDADV